MVQQSCQNSRLQIVGMRQAPGGTTSIVSNNCANAGTPGSVGAGPLNLGFTYGTALYNNGNLTAETIQAPNSGSGLNVTQQFTYDAYNRLMVKRSEDASKAYQEKKKE